MISNTLPITHGVSDLAAILAESEKVAAYNGLQEKQAMQLRLLCEELDGMLPQIVGEFSGKFYISFVEGLCQIHATIQISQLNAERRAELISIANSKKNAAAKGFVGKIRSALESLFLNTDFSAAMNVPMESLFGVSTGHVPASYAHIWSLNQYRQSVTQEQTEEWDALEKSMIASLADEVTVGVVGNLADIVISKKF